MIVSVHLIYLFILVLMLIIAVYDDGGGILAAMDSQITQIFYNIQPMLDYGGGLIERSIK